MIDSGVAWIGNIPEDWDILPVKRFFRSVKRISGKDADNYERLALTMSGVIKRSKTDNEGLQPEKFEGYQLLKQNELVFKLIDLENIKTSRIGLSQYTGLVSPAYIVLTNKQTDNRYYFYFFTYLYNQEVFNYLGGDGVRSAINAGELLTIPMINNGCTDQTRISNFLDKKCSQIDAIIEKQQKVIEKLKEYKQSIITEAVTKGLDPAVPVKDSGVEWIGVVPEQWVLCRFGNIASIKANLVSPARYPLLPQVSPEAIEKGTGKLLECKTVDESGVISWNHLFSEGQILYSKIRPLLNKVTIAPFDGLCSADMYPIETTINKNYLVFLMLSDYFLAQVGLFIANRVKMPKINQNELSKIYVAIPSDIEQQLIVDYLKHKCQAIDDLIGNKKRFIDSLSEYKNSLIYEVVTGKQEVS